MDNTNKAGGCGYKSGSLPGACAPLAMAYVPMQTSASPAYDPDMALQRGTLFPGLDLPFMNMVNSGDMENTPQNELMSMCFAVNELNLYLDTHPEDKEAFEAYKELMKLRKEARRRYVELYGPVMQSDMMDMDSYTWLKEPWPWDYKGSREG